MPPTVLVDREGRIAGCLAGDPTGRFLAISKLDGVRTLPSTRDQTEQRQRFNIHLTGWSAHCGFGCSLKSVGRLRAATLE
jgi:hypothetical protein